MVEGEVDVVRFMSHHFPSRLVGVGPEAEEEKVVMEEVC